MNATDTLFVNVVEHWLQTKVALVGEVSADVDRDVARAVRLARYYLARYETESGRQLDHTMIEAFASQLREELELGV